MPSLLPEERRNQTSIFQNPKVAWFVTLVTAICSLIDQVAPFLRALRG